MALPRQPERDPRARLCEVGGEDGVDADCAGRQAVDADGIGAEELPRVVAKRVKLLRVNNPSPRRNDFGILNAPVRLPNKYPI